jgi:hypothetical protein
MFFFTIVLVIGYGVATGEQFVNSTANGIGALPKLDEAFVILLGISHGTYLTRKALPDTRAAPLSTSAPTVKGAPVVGETLSASAGVWTPEPKTTTYAWERCETDESRCSPIPDAEAETYTLADDDAGMKIRVVVTASNAAGDTIARSALTDVVQAAAE